MNRICKLSKFLALLIAFVATFRAAYSAKILFYIGGVSSHSHRVGMEPLAIKLAEKGHEITFFSPLSPIQEHTNITNFCPSEMKVIHDAFVHAYGVIGIQSRLKSPSGADLLQDYGKSLFDTGYENCKAVLASSEFQNWLKTAEFDLMVLDRSSIPHCMYGLAHKIGAITMSYSAVSMLIPWDAISFGIPTENWWLPMPEVIFQKSELPVVNRFWNLYSSVRWFLNYDQYLLPKLDQITREGFNLPEMPPLRDLALKDSIMLLNIHHSDQFAKSLPPFVLPVGGMHLQEENKALPKNIESFLESKEFIYISFGSIVNISTATKEFLEEFFQAISALKKLKFLWKWEGPKPENTPNNVLLLPWFPQQDVLAHPKIRGFITQGGQCSIQQAIHQGVPLIVLPVNGDQDYNAYRINRAGNGITLELHDLKSETVVDAVTAIMENKTYTQVALKLKITSHERPLSALETAVWWTEYVLRHKGDTSFLKPPLMSWWVLLSLDVFGLIFLVISFTTISFSLLIFILVKLFLGGKRCPKEVTSRRKVD